MSKIGTLLAAPYLWAKAICDHDRAIKAFNAATRPDERQYLYQRTLDPFNRIFDHLIAAWAMSTFYLLLAVLLIGLSII